MFQRLEEFHDWLAVSTPGQVYIYHIGFLALDRGTIVDLGDGKLSFAPNGEIDQLGHAAIAAFDADKIHLFQRKIHDRVYQYIAMKRRNTRRDW